MNPTIQTRINAAMAATAPKTTARNKALAAVKWRLREACGLYAAIDSKAAIVLVPVESALVFDGRDDEQRKREFYELMTGGKFTVELVGCGAPTRVNGTNGGSMACGAELTWLDGSKTREYCGKCS